MLTDFLERRGKEGEREGGREREGERERETWIGSFPYTLPPTGDRTHNLMVYRTMLQPTELLGQAIGQG